MDQVGFSLLSNVFLLWKEPIKEPTLRLRTKGQKLNMDTDKAKRSILGDQSVP